MHDIIMLMNNKTKLYTITEAAKILGLTRQAVHLAIKNKRLKTISFFDVSKKLIDADAINEYMATKK